MELIDFLNQYYTNIISERYEIDVCENAIDTLSLIAEKRSCKLKGDQLDLNKAAAIVLDDFKSGKLGKITLEFPEK
jgi:ribosome biogenesis GTPase A